MSSGARYSGRVKALKGSVGVTWWWMLRRLPTFAGGLATVLILRYFLGEPFYPISMLVGVVVLIVCVMLLGTIGTLLHAALSGNISKTGPR